MTKEAPMTNFQGGLIASGGVAGRLTCQCGALSRALPKGETNHGQATQESCGKRTKKEAVRICRDKSALVRISCGGIGGYQKSQSRLASSCYGDGSMRALCRDAATAQRQMRSNAPRSVMRCGPPPSAACRRLPPLRYGSGQRTGSVFWKNGPKPPRNYFYDRIATGDGRTGGTAGRGIGGRTLLERFFTLIYASLRLAVRAGVGIREDGGWRMEDGKSQQPTLLRYGKECGSSSVRRDIK
jgi:hypothetical protein